MIFSTPPIDKVTKFLPPGQILDPPLNMFSRTVNHVTIYLMVSYGGFFKTVLRSGYILILLSIEYILASLIEMCQGQSRMRNVK